MMLPLSPSRSKLKLSLGAPVVKYHFLLPTFTVIYVFILVIGHPITVFALWLLMKSW